MTAKAEHPKGSFDTGKHSSSNWLAFYAMLFWALMYGPITTGFVLARFGILGLVAGVVGMWKFMHLITKEKTNERI